MGGGGLGSCVYPAAYETSALLRPVDTVFFVCVLPVAGNICLLLSDEGDVPQFPIAKGLFPRLAFGFRRRYPLAKTLLPEFFAYRSQVDLIHEAMRLVWLFSESRVLCVSCQSVAVFA